jgi:hypothetical protein
VVTVGFRNWLYHPRSMQRINGWLTIFWIVMVPVSYAMGWLQSVTYVSALSLWALVSGHWSAWEAARVDTRTYADADVADAVEYLKRIEQRIEDRIAQQADEALEEVADECGDDRRHG